MTPNWYALYLTERTARLDADERRNGLQAVLGLGLAALIVIICLCGAIEGADAGSHAVARAAAERGQP
jgi:hypothetical protein